MLHRWTEGLWDKGTGGGRWNYKIPMTEPRLNGNFLNWFWRGAQTEPAWGDIEMRRARGFLRLPPVSSALSLSLSLSGHVPALFTSGLICLFIPHLSFITTRPSFCFNLFYLTSTSHPPVYQCFLVTYLCDVIILLIIFPFYSTIGNGQQCPLCRPTM